jgi:hypothetical protein
VTPIVQIISGNFSSCSRESVVTVPGNYLDDGRHE